MADYPPLGFHFKVEFGLDGAGADVRFQEVSGLSTEIGIEELSEGGENRFVHRLPTRPKYGNLVLKRGLATGSKVIDWFTESLDSFEFSPVDVLVTLLNEKHEPLMGWSFVKARPVKLSVSDFKASEGAVVIETMELSYNFFRRV
ncbi:MAG: phage tail protein [Thermodesulfovibrionales bacterium]|jgi:phage tail-like protein